MARNPMSDEFLTSWKMAAFLLKKALISGLDRYDTSALYDVQMKTSSIIQWAEAEGRVDVIRDLCDIYESAFRYRRTLSGSTSEHVPAKNNEYVLWYGQQPGSQAQKESVLHSAQFIYAMVRLARASIHVKAENLEYARKSLIIALSHLSRWIFSENTAEQSFSRTSWGCGGSFSNHLAHLNLLANNGYGPKKSWSILNSDNAYCNVFQDVDLFILLIAIETVRLRKSIGQVRAYRDGLNEHLDDYVNLGSRIFFSRLYSGQFTDASNRTYLGAILDKGLWDAHRDMRYSGYEKLKYPGKYIGRKTRVLNAKPARGVGWDLGHARRFVSAYDTLAVLDVEVRDSIDNFDILRAAMGAQTIRGTWLGSSSLPRFTNYVDGSNGWYRVNYLDRQGYGIPPCGFSGSVISMGYGYLSSIDPEVANILILRGTADLDQFVLNRFDARERVQWISSYLLAIG